VTLNNTINVGSDPIADNIRNDGLIIINGGSLIVGGRIYGTGEIDQSSGAASFAVHTVIDTGGVTIAGGAAIASGSLLVGLNSGLERPRSRCRSQSCAPERGRSERAAPQHPDKPLGTPRHRLQTKA